MSKPMAKQKRKQTTRKGVINRRKSLQTQRAKDFEKGEGARKLERFLKRHFNRMAMWPVVRMFKDEG